MWFYLDQLGTSKSHRSAIVEAVASKINNMMPGIYDASRYEE
jgi:hypothetical protein